MHSWIICQTAFIEKTLEKSSKNQSRIVGSSIKVKYNSLMLKKTYPFCAYLDNIDLDICV